ncbi:MULTISPECIES: gas vesicle protein [unclassified Streptomyces]|uniref:gas vesicle protein GvpO n=1 Tax=unclassified Streptomyces TaxID=2593676 RepID=UPI00336A19CE
MSRAERDGRDRREDERDRGDDREPDRREDRERDRRDDREPDRRDDEPDRHEDRGRGRPRRRPMDARGAAVSAVRQVWELTGEEPEGVVSLERGEEGWTVGVEVVETHRVPDTADILALYRVTVDDRGDLVSYRRGKRYSRGGAEEG